MQTPNKKPRAPCDRQRGVCGGPNLGREGHLKSYTNHDRRATILRDIRDEQGRWQGLEVVA